jgi:hypothetical protein
MGITLEYLQALEKRVEGYWYAYQKIEGEGLEKNIAFQIYEIAKNELWRAIREYAEDKVAFGQNEAS